MSDLERDGLDSGGGQVGLLLEMREGLQAVAGDNGSRLSARRD